MVFSNCMDCDLAPKCVCGPNFASDLIEESPILSAAMNDDKNAKNTNWRETGKNMKFRHPSTFCDSSTLMHHDLFRVGAVSRILVHVCVAVVCGKVSGNQIWVCTLPTRLGRIGVRVRDTGDWDLSSPGMGQSRTS